MWREETPEGGNLLALKHRVTSFLKKIPQTNQKMESQGSEPVGGPGEMGGGEGGQKSQEGEEREAKSLMTQLKCVEN